jgi:ribulose-5-phosphate 4-epimerase/fuculose-1-phosphate aldolase
VSARLKPFESPDPRQLEAARTRLLAKGLLRVGDSISVRVPGAESYLHLVEAADGKVACCQQSLVGLSAGVAELHRRVYLARLDVGAILLNRQHWAAALPAAGGTLPGIFDEQLRQLGWTVTQIAPPTMFDERSPLAGGANAFGIGQQVLCLGMTLERLVFNAELLEKCAKAYLLARATGLSVKKIPWLVRWIATGRLRREQKRAAGSFARGELPQRSAGYK